MDKQGHLSPLELNKQRLILIENTIRINLQRVDSFVEMYAKQQYLFNEIEVLGQKFNIKEKEKTNKLQAPSLD